MKTFKTPKGTELPLRDMKGKDYLDVPYRVLWMREDHPDWGIETSFLQLTDKVAIAHSTIKNADGRILAQGTKTETPGGFADFVEKAETGSIGRALALCGYGTQFAQELEEGERIVDSPRDRKPAHSAASSEPGAFVMNFGKFSGKRLDEVGAHDLDSYLNFLKGSEKKSPTGNAAIAAIDTFLKTREFVRNK